MITKIAYLNVMKDQQEKFEQAFGKAQTIISKMPGYRGHELLKRIESKNKYVLTVEWNRLEDLTEGFRKVTNIRNGKNYFIIFMILFP